MLAFTAYVTQKGTVRYSGKFANGFYAPDINDNDDIREIPNLTNVKQIYTDYDGYNVYFLMEDGTVKGVGENYNGQLGVGTTSPERYIRQLPVYNVKEIIPYGNTTLFLLNDGNVSYCGSKMNPGFAYQERIMRYNRVYQTSITSFNISNVKKIRANNHMTNYGVFFLLNNNEIYYSGYNGNSQSGMYTEDKYNVYSIHDVHITLQKLNLYSIDAYQIKDIKIAYLTTFFLMKNSDVYAVGSNYNGQFGIGAGGSDITPSWERGSCVKVASNIKKIYVAYDAAAIFFITNDGLLLSSTTTSGAEYNNNISNNKLGQYINFNKKVKDCLCLYGASYFLLEDGSIKGCGNNIGFGLVRKNSYYNLTDIPRNDISRLMNIDMPDYKFLIKKKSSNNLYYTNVQSRRLDYVSDTNNLNFSNNSSLNIMSTQYTDEKNITHRLIDLLIEPFKIYMTKED